MPEPVVELDALGALSVSEQLVSRGVERRLGCSPPRTFVEWATRNISAFR
ncbi:hypothetical protein [Nocardia sp. NPDC049707]